MTFVTAMRHVLVTVLLVGTTATVGAEPPDLTRQKTWTEADKDAFYEWLEEQRRPAEDADRGPAAPRLPGPPASSAEPLSTLEALQRTPSTLSSLYLSTRMAGYDILNFLRRTDAETPVAGDGLDTGSDAGEITGRMAGAEVQMGLPWKTWLRHLSTLGYYRGVVDWRLPQPLSADISMLRVGSQLELALVPLGLDQTRNILLRGGVDVFHGRAESTATAAGEDTLTAVLRQREARMLDPVTGWRIGVSWAVGYEIQLGESFWRVHGVVDGFRAVRLPRAEDHEDWSALGLGVGLSRVL